MYTFRILQNWNREFFHSSILSFDKKCYLFNCSDGSQRNFMEQKVRFGKVTDIFYNSASSEANLGTYGFSMSRSEQIKTINEENKKSTKEEGNPKKLNYWGPQGFSQSFWNCDGFFFNINKQIYEFNNLEKVFQDKSKNSKFNFFEDENLTIYPICTINPSFITKQTTKELSNSKISNLKNNFAMSYICELKRPQPCLNLEKLKSLGVKQGPWYGKLKNGENVIYNDKEIKAEDVLLKPYPASCLMILYSPTDAHARQIVQQEKIKQFFSNNINNEDKVVSVITHLLGDIDILGTDYYQDFLSNFGADVIHIIDCPKTNSSYMINEKKTMIKYILNKVNDKLFICDHFTESDTMANLNLDIFISQNERLNKLANMSNFKNIITSKPGFEYKITPFLKRGVISEYLFPDPYYFKNENFHEFRKVIHEWIPENLPDICLKENPIKIKNEPDLVFLGTTSMKPLSYRNVSSIMMRLHNNYNLLLDCGEGTFQQIYSHFGNIKTDEILNNMKIIFITHKHGDHQLGLIKVLMEIDKLKKRRKADIKLQSFDDIIYIIAPKTIIQWIKNNIFSELIYNEHIIIIDNSYINPNIHMVYDKFIVKENELEGFVDVEKLSPQVIEEKFFYFTNHVIKSNDLVKDFYNNLREYLGINLFSIEVFHCDESYGVVVSEKDNNWKVSYSGDTRPCNNFLNYSSRSTALIHEATFENELIEDAKLKLHSTFQEGIDIGLSNQSWRTILTHFSPRYYRFVPHMEEFNKNKILLTHDFLSVKLSDLEWAYLYNEIYANIMAKIEEKNLNIFSN